MFSRFARLTCLVAASVVTLGAGPCMPSGAGPAITRTEPAKAFTHTTGIKFVVLPTGWVESRVSDIQLRRPVLMSAHEVTNAQYEKFLATYEPSVKSVPKGPEYAAARKEAKEFDAMILSRKRSKLSPDDNHPVNNVMPQEAEAFCKWLTKNDPLGRKYRLPGLVTWEYAARGGLNYKPYPWGDKIDKTKACYNATGAVPVGSFPPNEFGLYDMAGNVAEWVRTDDFPEYELRGGSWSDKKPEALHVRARGKLPEKKEEKKEDKKADKKNGKKDEKEEAKKLAKRLEEERAKLTHHGFRVLCEPPLLK